nr:RNA-directed DNA polymerase, eukaryota [Tanacetum cinerariifolium]
MTPEIATVVKKKVSKIKSKEDVKAFVSLGNFKSVGIPKLGGSILQLMEDLVNVGQTIGYKMNGCINNIEEIVKSQGETKIEQVDLFNIRSCWGNFAFDYVASPSIGGNSVVGEDNNDKNKNHKKRLKNMLANIDSSLDKGGNSVVGEDNNDKNKNHKKRLKNMLANIDSSLDKGTRD